ncbi:hypothetical protein EGK74_03985 [Neisseria weixii]|uniref:Uncharacterized protein n=2 Tax=Neisseria weixii TaxID=1853276 RepID=A0A3N4N5E7_9NEIS|nr:hypothetical protein EGK74_03985 [Neisseria weixii]
MAHGGAVCGARGLLSPEDRLTDAAWVIEAVENVLNDYELAVVELKYTYGLKADGIVDLTAFIEQQNKGVNLLICDALLAHIFGNLKQEAIQDKYNLGRTTLWRQKKKINAIVNALLNSAWTKLEIEFEQRKIIEPDLLRGGRLTFCGYCLAFRARRHASPASWAMRGAFKICSGVKLSGCLMSLPSNTVCPSSWFFVNSKTQPS